MVLRWPRRGLTGPCPYCHVDDIDATAESLAGAGADVHRAHPIPGAEHNYRTLAIDPSSLPGEALSTFVLDDGVVYHAYSADSRGTGPLGRNESGPWFRRRDQYDEA